MPILCDFSQIISAAVYMGDCVECSKHPSEQSKNMIKHSVINSVRYNFMQNKNNYGCMVLACDDSSWRYDEFPPYKYARKLKRKNDVSGVDWGFVDSVKSELIQEMDEVFPFPVLKINKAEGDDIIAVLTKHIAESEGTGELDIFGEPAETPILIISSDGDNYQLHKHKNVRQWSPMAKKYIKPDTKPRIALLEKIVKGDVGDGIPNIKMGDSTFIDGTRQRPISQVFLDKFYAASNPIDVCENDEQRRNYLRNEKLVSYEKIPTEYRDIILSVYNDRVQAKHSKSNFMNYLIKNKMTNLLSNIHDFYL